nr:MAG TPA: hypothetical protein [Caudoviricetes sp.]
MSIFFLSKSIFAIVSSFLYWSLLVIYNHSIYL